MKPFTHQYHRPGAPDNRVCVHHRPGVPNAWVWMLSGMTLAAWMLLNQTAMASPESTGKILYSKVGCVACYQKDGMGSSLAPMLPGHTAEQMKRYVRSPTGKMPRFGNDKVSDNELHAIATHIAGLPIPEIMPVENGPQDALEMHEWMAYRSLRDGDPAHAEHHLRHVLDQTTDEGHRRDVERAIALTLAKRMEDAAETILRITGAKLTSEFTVKKKHLRLALGALDAGDVPEVEHHVRHYVGAASPHDKRHARELLTLLKKGDAMSMKKRLTHLMAR
jgi:hypothetical protein